MNDKLTQQTAIANARAAVTDAVNSGPVRYTAVSIGYFNRLFGEAFPSKRFLEDISPLGRKGYRSLLHKGHFYVCLPVGMDYSYFPVSEGYTVEPDRMFPEADYKGTTPMTSDAVHPLQSFDFLPGQFERSLASATTDWMKDMVRRSGRVEFWGVGPVVYWKVDSGKLEMTGRVIFKFNGKMDYRDSLPIHGLCVSEQQNEDALRFILFRILMDLSGRTMTPAEMKALYDKEAES